MSICLLIWNRNSFLLKGDSFFTAVSTFEISDCYGKFLSLVELGGGGQFPPMDFNNNIEPTWSETLIQPKLKVGIETGDTAIMLYTALDKYNKAINVQTVTAWQYDTPCKKLILLNLQIKFQWIISSTPVLKIAKIWISKESSQGAQE